MLRVKFGRWIVQEQGWRAPPLTPGQPRHRKRQRRAEHKGRNKTMVDMNLVSLIDVFTILIFFLLSNSGGVETLPSPKAVKLPESFAEKAPRETVIVVVSGTEILVGGRRIASVADVLATQGRMHAQVQSPLPERIAGGFAINVTRYPDITDLYEISDVLIR